MEEPSYQGVPALPATLVKLAIVIRYRSPLQLAPDGREKRYGELCWRNRIGVLPEVPLVLEAVLTAS